MLAFAVSRSVESFLPNQIAGLRGHDERPVGLENVREPFIPIAPLPAGVCVTTIVGANGSRVCCRNPKFGTTLAVWWNTVMLNGSAALCDINDRRPMFHQALAINSLIHAGRVCR